MKRLFLLGIFFALTPVVLALASFVLMYSSSAAQEPKAVLAAQDIAKPEELLPLEAPDSPELGDKRIEQVRSFLTRYKSPLEPYAEHIVYAADTYDIDYRLLPAIAMQESNLCKKMPKDSNNCWGFGIYGKQVKRFSTFPEAINTVTKTLARDYKEKHGLETPEEIMSRYNPGNHNDWVGGVLYFLNELK